MIKSVNQTLVSQSIKQIGERVNQPEKHFTSHQAARSAMKPTSESLHITLTNDAAIEFCPHRHPSIVRHRMQTNIPGGDRSVKGVCYHNEAVKIASVELKIEVFEDSMQRQKKFN